jgi:hypothetical protein
VGDALSLPAAPIGELVVVDDGLRVVCHLCGESFASLPGHIGPRHGWTADQYREQFGLSRSASLSAPLTRARRREVGLARWAADLRVRNGLAVGQAMARSGELLKLSHAAQPRGTARVQTRRQARELTEGVRRTTAAAANRRLAERLAALGWDNDLNGYLHHRYVVDQIGVLVLARELGVGNVRIKRMLDEAEVPRRRPGGAGPARARWGRSSS